MRIGVDLMGSDTDATSLLKPVLALSEELKNHVQFTILVTQEVIAHRDLPDHITCKVVSEVVTMEEDPLHAVRRKKNSSIATGVRMVENKELDALVSAGNTGALIACSTMFLPTLPGIGKPALLTLMPTKTREVAVLDVGANISFKPDDLVQFATMGIAYQKTRGIEKPTVGLLNIGSEAKKGTPEYRETYQKLLLLNREGETPVFVGNIEGKGVFQGGIDVLVTDGFTGNVFLKTAEGISSFIFDELHQNALEECSLHLKGVLSALRHRLHWAEYPGAILCGVEGVVVKCHGDASPKALCNAIKGAVSLVKNSFLEKIKTQLAQDASAV